MTTFSGKAEILSPQFPKASFSETLLCCTKALSRAFVDIHLTHYVQLGSFTTKWMSWGFSPLQLLSLLYIHPQYSCAPTNARNVLYKHAHAEHLGTPTQFPAPLAASQKGLFLVQPRSSVYLMVCPVSAWENHLRSLCSFQEGCGGGIGHRKDWKDRWVCFGAVRWCVKYRTSQFWCEAYFWPRECCIKHSWRISVLKIQQCIAM